MNTEKLDEAVKAATTWQQTGIVRGVKIRCAIPKVGHAAYHGINGDTYGYIITEVAPDGMWFKFAHHEGGEEAGTGYLCTRKNSRLCGEYVMVNSCEFGYGKRRPSFNYRYCRYSIVYATNQEGCGETTLDPSF